MVNLERELNTDNDFPYTWQKVWTAAVILWMLGSLYKEWWSPEVVCFASMVLVWNAGIIGIDDALKGFNNKGMLAVGTLFVVVRGVENCQIVERLSRQVFGLKTSMAMGLLRMCTLTFFLSAFFNNTPIVALFIPIVRDWARVRGWPASYFLIPLSYAVICGGVITTIGTSTNLVVQGLLEDDGLQQFAFFAPGYVGLPIGLICVVYLAFAAPYLLKPRSGLIRDARDRAEDMITEVEVLKDFSFLNKPVNLVMAKLGVPPETIIKIRRAVKKETMEIIEQRNRSMSKEFAAVAYPSGSPVGPRSRAAVGGSDVENMGKSIMLNSDKPANEIELSKVWGEKQINTPKGSTITNPKEKFTGPEGQYLTTDTDNRSSGSSLSRKRVNDRAPSGGVTIEGTSSETKNGDDEVVGYIDEYPVNPSSVVQPGDILFLSCSTRSMIDLQNLTVTAQLRGLKVLDSHASDLPGKGTEYFELVLSSRNHFIGSPVNDREFSTYYDCTVLSLRRPGDTQTTVASTLHAKSFRAAAKQRNSTEEDASAGMDHASVEDNYHGDEDEQARADRNLEVSKKTFSVGYTLLVLAKKEFRERWMASGDFLLCTKVGTMPKEVTWFDYVPLLWFLAMLAWVTVVKVEMVRAAMAVAAILTIGGWVDAKKAVSYVDWGLLLLIGSALALSSAITNSGLADWIGNAIADSGVSAYGVLFLLYIFSALITELVTNNAAAALCYPLAISIADKLGVDYKAYAMIIMISASCSFLTPIGYQTNTMVWAPGGYSFGDFTLIGIPMTLLYVILTSVMVTWYWPLHVGDAAAEN